jgi:hypothetical protein
MKPRWKVVFIDQRSHWKRPQNLPEGNVTYAHVVLPPPRYHALLPGGTISICGIFPYNQTRISRPGGRPSKPLSWVRAPDGAEVTCPGCLKKIRAVMPIARPKIRRRPDPTKPRYTKRAATGFDVPDQGASGA